MLSLLALFMSNSEITCVFANHLVNQSYSCLLTHRSFDTTGKNAIRPCTWTVDSWKCVLFIVWRIIIHHTLCWICFLPATDRHIMELRRTTHAIVALQWRHCHKAIGLTNGAWLYSNGRSWRKSLFTWRPNSRLLFCHFTPRYVQMFKPRHGNTDWFGYFSSDYMRGLLLG